MREEDVAYEEVSTEDLLHRSRQSLDVGLVCSSRLVSSERIISFVKAKSVELLESVFEYVVNAHSINSNRPVALAAQSVYRLHVRVHFCRRV